MSRIDKTPLLSLLLLLTSCGGGSGDSGSTADADEGTPGAPISPPPLSIQIQALTNELPGIYKMRYVLLGDGNSAASVKIEYTTNGSQFFNAKQVAGEDLGALATGPTGIFHIFVWNSIEDLGMGANFASVRLRISAQDANETAAPVLSTPFPVQNAQLQSNLVQASFPNLADIQNQASSHVAATSVTGSSTSTGILKQSFSYTSSHYSGSGLPTNLNPCTGCPSLPQWKKDTWGPITADLYTPDGESPTKFLILQLSSEDTGVWSAGFSGLFPEFAASGDSISGASSFSQFDQGMLDEFAKEVAASLHVGVCVLSGLPQVHANWLAAGKDIHAAWLASADEALFRNDPRWCLTVGHAEALLRAGTAIEKIRALAPGSSQLLLADAWMGGTAALLGAATDNRVKAAACFSSEFGKWETLAASALLNFGDLVETFHGKAKKQVPQLLVINDLVSLGTAAALPSDASFANAFEPSRLIGLLSGLGKPVLVQAGSSDPRFPLQLRQLWIDDELLSYYPEISLHASFAGNFGHGMGSPQGIRNWRSFAAHAFLGRPLPKISASSVLKVVAGVPSVEVTATVNNPDPSTADILACRLRYAGDDDDDWRYLGPPDANPLTPEFDLGPCANFWTGSAEFCFDDAQAHRNRGWSSLLMTTSGNPSTDSTLVYTATIPLDTVTSPFLALFAEVEDEVLANAIANVGGSRSYTSSAIFFVPK